MRMTKLLLFAVTTLTFAAAAFAPTTAHAQAPDFRRYQSDTNELIEIIDAWTAEVERELEIVAIKPETARSAEFLSLIRRGHSMAADMRGTAEGAPRILRAKHDAATEAIFTMVEGLGIMADGGSASAIQFGVQHVRAGRADYSRAIRPVRFFASRAR